MTLFAEHSYHRVMVFIDYRNIYKNFEPMEAKGCSMDVYRLTEILVSSRELMGAYVFDGISKGDGDTNIMHDNLRKQGFRVKARDTVVREGNTVIQKEVDVSLACELLSHALLDHYDVAIVVSGDRDFVPAIKKVQEAGKRVEVASFRANLSEEVKRFADVYYELDDIPFFGLKSPTILPRGGE